MSSALPSRNPNYLVVPDYSSKPKSQISVGTKTQIDGSPVMRHTVKMSNVLNEMGRVVCDSWRDTTKQRYEEILEKDGMNIILTQRQSLCCRCEHHSRISSW